MDKPTDELTGEDVRKWTDNELAAALLSVAIASANIECARVCKEAATRLRGDRP